MDSKMWSPVMLLILSMGILALVDSESDELIAVNPIDGSMEIYRYFVPGAAIETDSSSFEDDGRRKRQVSSEVPPVENKEESPPKKILFSDLIGKVEGSIVQPAVNIAQLLKNSTGVPTSTTESSTNDTPVMKVKRTADTVSEATTTSNKDTVVKYVTAKKTTIVGEQLPRVAVDHIAVSDAKEGLGPLLSSLDFFANQAPKLVLSSVTATSKDGVVHQTGSIAELTVVAPKGAANLFTSTEAISSSTDTSSSAKGSAATEAPNSSAASTSPQTTASSQLSTSTTTASTTKAPSTTEPSATSSTKTPIEKLKEAEDDLKEKVAEIEADPIILSARV